MTKTVKRALTWGGLTVGLGLIVWAMVWAAQSSTPTGSVPAVDAQDHVRGSPTAKAVLIEYSDFQCPACKAYEPVVQQLTTTYGDRLGLVYRHFPLPRHQFGTLAARASEAAQNQGKFWEFHDLLFDRQSSWSQALDGKQAFIDYASELGLDTGRFRADIDSAAVKSRVEQDTASGNAAGVNGTPTFFLNGRPLTARSVADFIQAIDQALGTSS